MAGWVAGWPGGWLDQGGNKANTQPEFELSRVELRLSLAIRIKGGKREKREWELQKMGKLKNPSRV